MRLIHTSDWHLGQYFFNKSRAIEHQAFLNWLLNQVDKHQVDAIIVAGDIFDTGSPPSYARQMYNQFIVDLQRYHCQLVVLGGNHDSVATLNESTNLLKCLNTQVVAGVSDDPDEQVLVLKDQNGEPGALVCAIPYIRPRDVLTSTAGQSAGEKNQSLLLAISEHYRKIFDHALARRQALGNDRLPIIATGHLMALGVSKTDSVRDIYIGSLEAYPAAEFPAADYIALGHMHRAQKVAKQSHIRYCGSPIPLSFDEIGQQKEVLMVDLSQGKLDEVTPLPVPLFQPMQMIKGDLLEIEQQLSQFTSHDDARLVWLDIEVISHEFLPDLQARVVEMAKDLPVEILLLRRQRKRHQTHIDNAAQKTLNELNAFEVFDKRLALETFEQQDEKARLERVKTAFAEIEAKAQLQVKEGLGG